MPVASMIRLSNRRASQSFFTSSIRSPRSVQQMQPLLSSINDSSVRDSCDPPERISSLSIFTSDMSLTMTATRRPIRFKSNSLSSVVLPAPRKPDKTVTGSFFRPNHAMLDPPRAMALFGGDGRRNRRQVLENGRAVGGLGHHRENITAFRA